MYIGAVNIISFIRERNQTTLRWTVHEEIVNYIRFIVKSTAINHVDRSDTSVAGKLRNKNDLSMFATSHVEMKQLQR